MAIQVHIVHYGTRDAAVIPVNNTAYAAKIAAGLERLANALKDPDTEFVAARDFVDGTEDNTWVHVSMATEPTVVTSPDDSVDIIPRAQFNSHFLIKCVTDEDELADGLDTLTVRGG